MNSKIFKFIVIKYKKQMNLKEMDCECQGSIIVGSQHVFEFSYKSTKKHGRCIMEKCLIFLKISSYSSSIRCLIFVKLLLHMITVHQFISQLLQYLVVFQSTGFWYFLHNFSDKIEYSFSFNMTSILIALDFCMRRYIVYIFAFIQQCIF